MTTDLTPFRGIWPALMTPLKADLTIDHERFGRHALRLLEAGCGGVTPFGTTGEGPAFSVDERREAVDRLIAAGVPASRIIVSTSCAALPDTLVLTRHALQVGAHGCLMLPPYFLKGVPDEGICDAYRWLFGQLGEQAATLRLYLYHIPQVAGVGLSHAVIETLLREYPRHIAGLKDSQCDRAHSVGVAERFGSNLAVYVGNELDLPTMGRLGSRGAISGLANFMPRTVHALVSEPDADATPARHERVATLLQRLGGYALIPALKGLQALLDGDEAWCRVRPPLRAVDAPTQAALGALARELALDPTRD